MKKAIMNIFMTIFYFMFCLIYVVYGSIHYLLKGRNIIGKLSIVALYVGLAALMVFKPLVFAVIAGIIAIGVLLVALYLVKNHDKFGEGASSTDSETNTGKSQKNPFFEGMSLEEAKKEYRKLMKKYHPDNVNGDAEMSKKISVAYSQYCTVYER